MRDSIVYTAVDSVHWKGKLLMDVRARIVIYSLTTGQSRIVGRTSAVWPDMGVGDHLALRRHGRDWALSFHFCGPGDSRSYWLNLTTGRGVLADEGDPLFEYSPDGRYVLAEQNLYKALTWPRQRPRSWQRVRGTKLVSQVDGPWSPDSRRIVNLQPDVDSGPKEPLSYRGYSILTVSTLKQSPVVPCKGLRDIKWAGPDHLLIFRELPGNLSELTFTDLTHHHQRLLCRSQ